MIRANLDAELASAGRASTFLHAKRLEQLGVSIATVAELRRHDWGWGVVHAVEHPSEPGLYCPDSSGPLHVLLPVYDRGDLVDLVAFRSSDPERWLLRTGAGWCLGLEGGFE